ncbi:MAG: ribosome small subunit-dependent GTPase A [Clostridia bacterium]|nr:ribosome small subunit-dependent GTPase A [Clostridia bacterium]
MQYDGLIIKGIGGFYYVEAAAQIFECKAKGIFRKEKITPVAGDRVVIEVRDNGQNTIEEIKERKNILSRPPVANIDKLFIVSATCEPNPSTLIIDRLTVIAEKNNIEPIVVFTKKDLKPSDELEEIYRLAGIKCYSVSCLTGEGTDAVKKEIDGAISAFTGNTGVGKSSLLNAIDPALVRSTGEISSKLGRGKHTTRQVELYKIGNAYVADTPGFSSLDIESGEVILKDDIQFYFREFNDYIGTCKFASNCSHIGDKGCSIVDAVNNGIISKSRHESYKMMYDEVKNIKEWQL